MGPVVGVSVQTKHVISDEAVVGEWLEPAVRKVIDEVGVDVDADVLAAACTMKFCFMHKTRALRQRLMEHSAAAAGLGRGAG